MIVVLDIVTGDLQVMHISVKRLDPGFLVPTDVIAMHDNLMQVAIIKKQAEMVIVQQVSKL